QKNEEDEGKEIAYHGIDDNPATMSIPPRRADAVSLSKSCADTISVHASASREGRRRRNGSLTFKLPALYEDDGDEECWNPALNQLALYDRLSPEEASLHDALLRRPSLKLARVLVGRRWLRSDEKTRLR